MVDADRMSSTGSSELQMRTVLRIPAFRKLWVALSLSSFGDWLGLLALTALAQSLASGSYASANLAVAAVFILRLLPAVVLGPIAGAVADRLDRRWTMVTGDVSRGLLFLSIPFIDKLWWLFVVTFLIEVASLFWIPAKEATVPNLVPPENLQAANQVSLLSTYGSAPVAAAVFTGLTLLSGVLDNAFSFLGNPVDLALGFNGLTFFFSAVTIFGLRAIPKIKTQTSKPASFWHTVVDGWKFVGSTPLVRGLVVGMLGAFAAGGAVIGLARTYVRDLGGGDPGYGVLFAAVFVGMAAGMGLGPRLVHGLSRARVIGLSLTLAGLCLAVLALIPNIAIATLITTVIGFWAGLAWVTGYTVIGLEVTDELRGRTFAFLQTMIRVTLALVLAVAPVLAATVGRHQLRFTDDTLFTLNGAAVTLLIFGLLAAVLGVVSYRQMDDRKGIRLASDLTNLARGRPLAQPASGPPARGYFIAFEGGDGAGKSTQAHLVAAWLRERGHEVVLTREPGATRAGQRIREVLLDPASLGLSDRAEALLYAADRAEHVHRVIKPALAKGAIVISDRYVDSSLAYQGVGRSLTTDEVSRISRWATEGLVPHLTVVLDIPAAVGLERSTGPADRVEAEPAHFHERVRQSFRALAAAAPARYLVIDATLPPERVNALIRERLRGTLPLSATEAAEVEAAKRLEEQRAEAERMRVAQLQQAAAELQRAAEARRQTELAEIRRAEEAAKAERARQRADAKRAAATAQTAAAVRAAREKAEADARRKSEDAAREAAERARREAEHTRRVAETQSRRAAKGEERRIEHEQRVAAKEEARRLEEEQIRREEERRSHVSLADDIFGLGDADDTIEIPRDRQ